MSSDISHDFQQQSKHSQTNIVQQQHCTNVGTIRKKSSHYKYQIQIQPIEIDDSKTSNFNNSLSPSRYVQDESFHLSNRISSSSTER